MIRKLILFGGIFCALQALSLLGMSSNAHHARTKEDQELTHWMLSLSKPQQNADAFTTSGSVEAHQKSPKSSSSPKSPTGNASPNSNNHEQMLALQKRLASPWASPIGPCIHLATSPSSGNRSQSPETLPNFPETYLPLREQAIKHIKYLEMIRICTQAALAAQATPATIIKHPKPASKSSKRQKRASQTSILKDITNRKNNRSKSKLEKVAGTNELRRSVRIQNRQQNKENMA